MAKKKAPNSRRVNPEDDTYFSYFEETKDATQRRSWTFYEAIKPNSDFESHYSAAEGSRFLQKLIIS
jgi:hypothetical protein